MTQIVEHDQNELEKVASWRLHVLIEAGYPLPLAERLAHSEADLHSAVELVRRGCAPGWGCRPPATRGERSSRFAAEPGRNGANLESQRLHGIRAHVLRRATA